MKEETIKIEPQTISLFLRMVGDFLAERPAAYEDCADVLDQLIYLARIHSLEPVIYYMLKDQRENLMMQRLEYVSKLQKAYHSAIYWAVAQESSMMEMEESFSKAGIPLVFFKGAQLRNLYPIPELRTMGDLDCLIYRKDRAIAHQRMLQLGYECQVNTEPVWTYHRGTVVIEMHTHLAADGLGNGVDYHTLFSDAVERVVELDGHLCLEREYYFCYLIYHIAKHLSSTGAGVRMVADIGAWIHRYGQEMDERRVTELLKRASLWKTASAIYQLCHRWFDLEVPAGEAVSEQTMNALEAYILSGGTFGFETHDAGDIYRKKALRNDKAVTGWKYWIKLTKTYLFPPKRYLMQYFPPAEEHAWLLPVAWFRRCWGGLFCRNARSLSIIRSIADGDAQRSYREAQMLRDIDL